VINLPDYFTKKTQNIASQMLNDAQIDELKDN